ncbi:MAG TPA: hypothetical protein VNP93_09850 [Gaiellaceae bacterium]|nr:hypothetical protein [Gaiellaceae bacterium]
MTIPPFLVALGVLVAGFLAGVILIALDFDLIGFVVVLASIPVGLVAWIVANDRA